MSKSVCSTSLDSLGHVNVTLNASVLSVVDWKCPNGHVQSIIAYQNPKGIICDGCIYVYHPDHGKYVSQPYVAKISNDC